MKYYFVIALLLPLFCVHAVPSATEEYIKMQAVEAELKGLRDRVERTEAELSRVQQKLNNVIEDAAYKNKGNAVHAAAEVSSVAKKPEEVFDVPDVSIKIKKKRALMKNAKPLLPKGDTKSDAKLAENALENIDRAHNVAGGINTKHNTTTADNNLSNYISDIRYGDVNRGISGMMQHIKSTPEGSNLSVPYYWLGKGFFRQKTFDKAAFYLTKSYKQKPASEYSHDALFFTAVSFKNLGKKDRACGVLEILEGADGLSSAMIENIAREISGLQCQ